MSLIYNPTYYSITDSFNCLNTFKCQTVRPRYAFSLLALAVIIELSGRKSTGLVSEARSLNDDLVKYLGRCDHTSHTADVLWDTVSPSLTRFEMQDSAL